MVKQLVPSEIDVNSAPPEFWARYHAYRRARLAETRPDDPVVPDEVEEVRLRRPRDFEITYRCEISRGDEMLSWFGCGTTKPGAPGYEQNRHLMGASWAVVREHRREGIGSMWLPVVLEKMERHGCTTLTVGADEDSGHEFLKWVGAQPKLTDRESRLQLADVDWDMVARWVAEGVQRNPSTKLEIYDGRLPEAMWDDYSAQISRLLNTIPFDDLDHGEIVITAAMTGEWYDGIDKAGETLHTMITREADGAISSMTDVKWAAHTPAVVQQQFTGVDPSARGRGLGKWIKAAMLEHVRGLHPEAAYVSTWNAASNAAMLGINNALGFKLHRLGIEYQISRDDLAARVRSLGL